MAGHPTKLFLEIYEPIINIFLEAGEEMGEMNVVKLGTGADAGEVLLCANADRPYGWCTQNVTTTGQEQYSASGLLVRTAAVGDKIGVYVNGGILKTDNSYISRDKTAILIESLAIEKGVKNSFLALISRRNDGVVVRIHPVIEVEKTSGVKNILSEIAKQLLADFPQLTIGETNLSEYLK